MQWIVRLTVQEFTGVNVNEDTSMIGGEWSGVESQEAGMLNAVDYFGSASDVVDL